MSFKWIYNRVLIVPVFILALAFAGWLVPFGGEAYGAGGSTATYTTNGGLGEGYVPKPHKQRTYPKFSDSYGNEEKPANPAVTTTSGDGSAAVFTTNGGLGEGYVSKPRKKSPPRSPAFYEEEKKEPVSSTVVFTTGDGKTVKAVPGTIAPGWQPSTNDHSFDFLKNFLHRILPPSKEGVAEKRAAEEVGDSVTGKVEKKPASAAVQTSTDSGQAFSGSVINGTIAPGWQPSKGHSSGTQKGFFQRLWPWGSSDKAEDSEVKTDVPGASMAPSSHEISGEGKAVDTSDKPLSERRSERGVQPLATGVAPGSEDVSVPDEPALLTEDDRYLDYDDEEFADITEGEAQAVADPIEGLNRAMFTVNDRLYFWIFRPLASGYSRVVPEPGRVAVRRFFDNVFMPVRFANNVFQLKFKYAGVEVERFVINTTVGVLGFMDPAKDRWNLEMHDEDFGQTLGFYGFGPGMYLNLPVFGPSNVRDALGMVADIFLSPMAYILPHDREIVVGISAFDKLNRVSLNIGLYEDIKRDSLDPYIFIRNAYQQHRVSVIKE